MTEFRYVGFRIVQTVRGIVINQSEYTAELENVIISPKRAVQTKETLASSESTSLRELAGRLNWEVQGPRPDMTFEMAELSTKFKKKATVADLTRAKKAVNKLKEERSVVFVPQLASPEV